ncbi:MAG: hypothetical protein R3B93_13545 [Bacteroidia bacterium]
MRYLDFSLPPIQLWAMMSFQTLGTFLTSNDKRPWWVLWLYAGGILTAVMVYGWATHGGDMAYGRLEKFPLPETLYWWYIIPPLTLLVITRLGIPISTTFLILSVFGTGSTMGAVILKSIIGCSCFCRWYL